MKHLIEDIYDNYYFEKSADNSLERKKALREVIEKQNKLKSKLKKSEKLLEDYDNARTNLEWASNKETFVDGVYLGAKFILEILTSKEKDVSDNS